MPTPACLATAVIGAPGSATNTARADSRMRWSLRAASAWRPLIGPLRPALLRPAPGRALVSVMEIIVPEDWNKPFRSDSIGTEDFVTVERAQRWTGESTGGSDVVSDRDQKRGPHGCRGGHERHVALGGVRRGNHGGGDGPARLDHRAGR